MLKLLAGGRGFKRNHSQDLSNASSFAFLPVGEGRTYILCKWLRGSRPLASPGSPLAAPAAPTALLRRLHLAEGSFCTSKWQKCEAGGLQVTFLRSSAYLIVGCRWDQGCKTIWCSSRHYRKLKGKATALKTLQYRRFLPRETLPGVHS